MQNGTCRIQTKWDVYIIIRIIWIVTGRRTHGVVANVLNCDIVVSEFELQSCFYVYIRTNTIGKYMNPIVLSAIGEIVPLLFFYKNSLDFKLPAKFGMPLNKETKTNQSGRIWHFNLSLLVKHLQI